MNTYKISGYTLHVDHTTDPYSMEYVCTDDNYDGTPIDWETPSRDIIGRGDTELEAIYDWIEKTLERGE
jgi:hypothetical protein